MYRSVEDPSAVDRFRCPQLANARAGAKAKPAQAVVGDFFRILAVKLYSSIVSRMLCFARNHCYICIARVIVHGVLCDELSAYVCQVAHTVMVDEDGAFQVGLKLSLTFKPIS